MTKYGICKLCCKGKELQKSHIIPKFVFDWLKESSGTGFLRSNEIPNKRVQDGRKEPMLCGGCESLFNQWETPFATKIFHPLNMNAVSSFRYESWLLKFAVSVSWRVLTWYISNDVTEFSESAKTLIDKALQTWKEFLLDKRSHPDSFEQHIILLDMIESIENINDLPPNMNRFMIRGCHVNLAHSNGHPLFIYTKMGRITLLGFIGIKNLRDWVGTRIHVKQGIVGGDIVMPLQFLDYIKYQATAELRVHDRISERQKKVISKTYIKDINRVVMSETFQVLDHDVWLFGENAVFGKNGDSDEWH